MESICAWDGGSNAKHAKEGSKVGHNIIFMLGTVVCVLLCIGVDGIRDDDNILWLIIKYLLCFGLCYCCLRIAIRLSFTSVDGGRSLYAVPIGQNQNRVIYVGGVG